jgi:hypothetical protein
MKLKLTHGALQTQGLGYIFVAMYCERFNIVKAEKLAASLKKLNLPFALFKVPSIHQSISLKGSENLAYTKPNFIQTIISRVDCPVIYIDSDCEILQNPTLFFDHLKYDFGIFNWLSNEDNSAYARFKLTGSIYYTFSHSFNFQSEDQLICSGAVQFWSNTEASKSLLSIWHKTIVDNPLIPDDQSLDFTFNFKLSPKKHNLKFFWLPKSYARYAFWIFDRPVINHSDFPCTDIRPEFKSRMNELKIKKKVNKPLISPGVIMRPESKELFVNAGGYLIKIGEINFPIFID